MTEYGGLSFKEPIDLLFNFTGQFFACLELNDFLRGNLDRFAGLRIPALSGFSFNHRERAKADQSQFAAFLELFRYRILESIQSLACFILGNAC